MATVDSGRLCAIVKILDQASMHLRLATREQTTAAQSGRVAAALPPDPTACTIASLLGISETAAACVRRALVHLSDGEQQRAVEALRSVGTHAQWRAAAQTATGRMLPHRVTTAVRLMRGIRGLFTVETEQALGRVLDPAGHALGW
ncbi:hypothetical protein [Streptomyces sp. NBC_01304]|uniref:hypothetical protein n=1 Tax=Streptomyces sp. NBC_01304 TaxID=2903818 RepID=UPI002E1460E7|nr:hypothetical protein OG430_44200 [Streptomyces sp. NBC_01304]